MKRKTQGPEAEARAARPAVKSATLGNHGGDLEEALALIRKHPGIRPSELNRLLNSEESDGLRGTLIKRGLVRKEKDGSAMRYYPVDQ